MDHGFLNPCFPKSVQFHGFSREPLQHQTLPPTWASRRVARAQLPRTWDINGLISSKGVFSVDVSCIKRSILFSGCNNQVDNDYIYINIRKDITHIHHSTSAIITLLHFFGAPRSSCQWNRATEVLDITHLTLPIGVWLADGNIAWYNPTYLQHYFINKL